MYQNIWSYDPYLGVCPYFFKKDFNLLITFEQPMLELLYCTFVFLMKTAFYGYHHVLTLRPWSVSLAYFLKTLNFVKFQQWVLELSYCRMWAFLVTRSLYWYRNICPCDLDHLWNGYYRGVGCWLYFSKFNTSLSFSFFLSLCISLSFCEWICFFWLFLSLSIFFCMTLF